MTAADPLLEAACGPFVTAVRAAWEAVFLRDDGVPLLVSVMSWLVQSGDWMSWLSAWLDPGDEHQRAERLKGLREVTGFDDFALDEIREEMVEDGQISEEAVDDLQAEDVREQLEQRFEEYLAQGLAEDLGSDGPGRQYDCCCALAGEEILPPRLVGGVLDDLELPYRAEGRVVNGLWRSFPRTVRGREVTAGAATGACRGR